MMTLYRHYNKAGDLMYVGISRNEEARRRQHKGGSRWFDEVVNTTIETHGTLSAAREAEKIAILNENPVFNIAGRPSEKEKWPIRNIRIEDATWKKLVKLSEPESVSILVRKILRDYVSDKKE